MRKGRFAGLSENRPGAAPALGLADLLRFDFLAADDSYDARIASERTRALAWSAPFLIAAHLVCAGALVLAAIGAGAPLPPLLVPLGALVLLDARLWLLSARGGDKAPPPHRVVRLTALYAVLGGLLWILAGTAAGAAGSADAPLVAVALAGGIAATALAFLPIPGLVAIAAAAAAGLVLSFTADPAGLALAIGFASAVVALSLLRARDALLTGQRRLVADWQADQASRFVEEFERSGAGWFWETDADGALTYVSEPLARDLEKQRSDLIGRKFAELLLIEQTGGTEVDNPTLGFHLGARFPFSDVTVAPNGREGLHWSLSGRPHFDELGRFLGFRGIGANLSEQKRSETQSRRLARTDSLTGLPNRARMEAMLEEALANAASRKQGCSLFLIDLDKFKQVNDTLGHPVGDALLKEVAQRLARVLDGDGQAGRLGGDEFMGILPGIEEEGRLAAIAERLVGELSAPYAVRGHSVTIGASVGIAIARPGRTIAEALVKEADLALYAAKGAGRGTFRFFDEAMTAEATDRKILEADLRAAVARGELRLAYQPIVDTGTEDLVGFEALVRWAHPVRGPLSPADFLPIAEASGLIVPIGEWILRTACIEAAGWPRHLRLSVNLSLGQIAHPALAGTVAGALAASGLDPERLHLEFREEVLLDERREIGGTLASLQALGIGLALDDFGAGQSNMVSLSAVPLARIKIHPTLMRAALPEESRARALIAAVVAVAAGLELDVTVEGAETLEELHLIRALGCGEVQGFLFGRPMPPEEAARLAAESRPVCAREAAPTRPPRHSLIRRGTLVHGERRTAVRLRNVSAGGAMIESDRPFAAGERVALDLSEGVLLDAEVRWSQDGRLGLRFVDSFDLQRLGRSRPDGAAKRMVRPDYLRTETSPDSPWAARTEKLTIKEVKRR